MTAITEKQYHLNPTIRLVDDAGRATAEFRRILTAIGKVLESVTIVDGEITTAKLADLAVQASKLDEAAVVIGKLAAGSIHVSTLFADEVVITSKVAQNAITDVSIGQQVGSGTPNGATLASAIVPVTSTGNTGVILTFTAVQGLPAVNASNFGSWRLVLYRNGVSIDTTGDIYYDDNFANLIAVQFVDESPGTNPTYSIAATTISGPGDFSITDGVLNGALFKR